ncbi:SUMF1/EgtB/PvdO family nonheme iron enzyme [Pseudodesulfovibrio sp. zrk46]|uniref:SUMF1/EgtB/PvdO family nonheme iron enzyme n=1 Tax=Pseudodesulfovibrio sp. zrk46 TaxID=2725288 RepID=UPI0014497597|nr:SUMF1/EgtB/PvdO family nonheme iron enzyme [Pseudodesulfovibrio sp. zrk46]QJB56890.1 SUMF1/EgtB/PvdO family nonheme iron enzyme [Pseudodesulfovibrio sp. zrk46]
MAMKKDQFREALRAGRSANGDSQEPELNNRLTEKLQQEKAQKRRLLLVIGVVAGVFLSVAATLAFMAHGTTVLVEPQEAAENASIDVGGFGFLMGDYALSFSSDPAVTVSSPGYQTARVDFPDGDVTLHVSLEESPAQLSLKLEPAYEDARWTLNGMLVGTGATLEKEVPAGDYELKVASLSFMPTEQSFTVDRGQEFRKVLVVEPVKGKLDLASTPVGATIFLNGEDIGVTPQTVDVLGGKHEVMISLAEHSPVTETIAITSAKTKAKREYHLFLQPGELTVNAAPKGGLLLVNGLKATPSEVKSVPPRKEVLISYKIPGFSKKTESVTLAPGEKRTITMNLKSEKGVVEIISTPAAEVVMNGTVLGQAPLTISMPTVQQTIVLRAEGYQSITQKVIPKKGVTTRVNVKLVSNKQAAMAKATKAAQSGGKGSAVGMEMALFSPAGDMCILGAPRHEQGQRANEFQRKVKLVRPFLAGRYEVSNGQFARFSGSPRGPQNQPVVNVTWLEAAKFCNWLSAQEHLPPFYVIQGGKLRGMNKKSKGYRLLTEAEWEWLARKAGRKQQTIFPWGDTAVIPDDVGNIADESAQGKTKFYVPGYNDNHAGLAPVGSFKPNESGLYDLTGNVSEWVNDFYVWQVPKAGQILIDPLGPAAGEKHVYKGSSWRSGTRTPLRAAYRDPSTQGKDDLGFRVARYVYADE